MNRRALSGQYINCLSSHQFSCKGDDWHTTLHIYVHSAWYPRPVQNPNRPMFDAWVYMARLGGVGRYRGLEIELPDSARFVIS
jgi:hypothetical protein